MLWHLKEMNVLKLSFFLPPWVCAKVDCWKFLLQKCLVDTEKLKENLKSSDESC